MRYDYTTRSRKGGNRFSSTATIHRWKGSSQRRIQIVAYGAYSSTPRVLADPSTLWRYCARISVLILLSHTGTQMFTDFVAECRAERLKSRLTKASVDTSTNRQKDESIFKEALELTAVAA
jgi:hypothetical protein